MPTYRVFYELRSPQSYVDIVATCAVEAQDAVLRSLDIMHGEEHDVQLLETRELP